MALFGGVIQCWTHFPPLFDNDVMIWLGFASSKKGYTAKYVEGKWKHRVPKFKQGTIKWNWRDLCGFWLQIMKVRKTKLQNAKLGTTRKFSVQLLFSCRFGAPWGVFKWALVSLLKTNFWFVNVYLKSSIDITSSFFEISSITFCHFSPVHNPSIGW